MIRSSDIDLILNRRSGRKETIEEWCARNDVAESVIHRIVALYGVDTKTAAAAIEGFRLGHEARKGDEPKGQTDIPGPRYSVQSVVVDTRDGHIVGSASPSDDWAFDLAHTYNDADAATEDSRR